MDNKEKKLSILKKYLPGGYEHFVLDLLEKYPVKFAIVAPRSTKLGDFRVPLHGEKPRITINNDLNPYSFLITTVHEFAHLIAFQRHGNKIKPHGDEWKSIYSQLIFEMIQYGQLPKDVEIALMDSLCNVKASSCSDLGVSRVLKKYDAVNSSCISVESLNENTIFAYRNRRYKIINKRRTRYLCEEVITKKRYLFHALTIVDDYDK